MEAAISIAQIATAIAALAALAFTVVGWKKTREDMIEQARVSAILSTNYEIYQKILQNVNEISAKNSLFTTAISNHANIVADILNRWHGKGDYEAAGAKEKLDLMNRWKHSTEKIVDEIYSLQRSTLELTRLLDMSGADFGESSKIYNSLWLVYHDLNRKSQKTIDKWTTIDLENTNKEQYDWLLDETYELVDEANSFSNCVEDVLKHVYNKLVAYPMKKTPKRISTKERRRMITEEGLRDNRIENAS